MHEITLQDIVKAGTDQSMRISVETAEGFRGDNSIVVAFNEFCHKESIVRTIVSALFDHGDKVTLFGELQFTQLESAVETFEVSVMFSVDYDSITVREEI